MRRRLRSGRLYRRSFGGLARKRVTHSTKPQNSRRRRATKILHRLPDQEDEDRQHYYLRDQEWWFGIVRGVRRERVQRRHFQEQLGQQHEEIQIHGDAHRHRIDPAPGAGKFENVLSKNGEREQDEREDGDLVRGKQHRERKQKAGHVSSDHGDEERRRPDIRPPVLDQQ